MYINNISIYGVSTAANDFDSVRPLAENNELFQAVVEYYGETGNGWCKVKKIGKEGKFYEILLDKFHRKNKPQFLIDEVVFVPRKMCKAIIYGIGWHFKRDEYVYSLVFNGKRSSRRYFCDELRGIVDNEYNIEKL